MKSGRKIVYAILFAVLLVSVQTLLDYRQKKIRGAVAPNLERLVALHPQSWRPVETAVVTSPAWKNAAESDYDEVAARSYMDEQGNRITIVMTWSRDGIQRAGHIQQLCYTTQGFDVSKPRTLEVGLAGKRVAVTMFEASRLGGEVDDVLYWRVTGGKLLENIMETSFHNYRLSHRILKVKELLNHLGDEIPSNIMVRISSVRSMGDGPSALPLQYLQQYIPLLSSTDRHLLLGE